MVFNSFAFAFVRLAAFLCDAAVSICVQLSFFNFSVTLFDLKLAVTSAFTSSGSLFRTYHSTQCYDAC